MMGLNKNLIGQKLENDVYSETGIFVVPEGTYITEKVYEKLEAFNITSVHVKKHLGKNSNDEEYIAVKSSYVTNVDAMKNIINDISTKGTVNETDLSSMVNSITTQSQKMGHFIDCIHELKSADEYTYNHSINVSVYSMLIGTWLKFSDLKIQQLVLAGLLHDVGKSKIPSEILNKNGRLTETEFVIIKKHSEYGYNMIKDMKNVPQEVKLAVLLHHEKVDGSGYPLSFKESKIPLFAQILAVADVYDALTSKRVYKDKITPFETFKEMSKMGFTHFSADILMTFLKNIVYYYVGFKLKLNTGEIGEILYVSPLNNYQPLIKVNGRVIDLANDNSISIVEVI